MEALEVNKKARDYTDLASAYNNIGELYFSRKQYKKALDYDFQSLQIWRKAEPARVSGILSDVGNCYFYLEFIFSIEIVKFRFQLFCELIESTIFGISMKN